MKTIRSCIYPKDIQCITGKSERYGRHLLQKIRKHLDKQPHQYITTDEFSAYTGIKVEIVEGYLGRG